MYKEVIFSIIIITLLVIGDVLCQNYVKNNINSLIEDMQKLKENLEQENTEEAIKSEENTKQKWENIYHKLAYYIEHNELEKVDENFIECMSFTTSQNYDFAISKLDKTVLALEHIADKYQINLENIF